MEGKGVVDGEKEGSKGNKEWRDGLMMERRMQRGITGEEMEGDGWMMGG